MDEELYSTTTLLGVFWADDYMEPPENYFLNTFFPGTIQFDTEEIDFSKIADNKKIAPLVVPTAQGVPIYSAAERKFVVAPAYIKIKDPVSATRVVRRAAGLGELGRKRTPLTPSQRWAAIVTDVIKQHRFAVERRWELLAADAVQFGKVLLKDERYPERLVDFQRDPSHTVILTSGNRWGDAGVSIVDMLSAWKHQMKKADFGGIPARLTLGVDAWEAMRQDPEIREFFMNNNYRTGTAISLKLGPLSETSDVEQVGSIESLQLYVYSGSYDDVDGTEIPYMQPDDVLLTADGKLGGQKCFGTIQDKRAGLTAQPVFQKMWDEEDPSATNILTQSAPLMVPVNPNASLLATVV